VLRCGDSVLLYRVLPHGIEAPRGPAARDRTTFGRNPLSSLRLSDVERRVLQGMRGAGGLQAGMTPARDREVAERTSLEEADVRAAIAALALKLGVEGATEQQRRERLVVRALTSGLIAESGGG
jgi:hypothetical protein